MKTNKLFQRDNRVYFTKDLHRDHKKLIMRSEIFQQIILKEISFRFLTNNIFTHIFV